MLSKEDKKRIGELIQKYQNESGPLISILQETQDVFGYLPQDVLSYLSQKLKISESKIWGIVTFYGQFYLAPRGKNIIKVCLGTACHVRGAPRILEEIERKLDIKSSETTRDHNFTLETVNCLGACALGPLMVVNKKYFGKMTLSKVKEVLDMYKKR